VFRHAGSIDEVAASTICGGTLPSLRATVAQCSARRSSEAATKPPYRWRHKRQRLTVKQGIGPMTEAGKPTKAPHLRLIVNETFVCPVETAATKLADRLEAAYAAQASKSGVNFASSIDIADYPEDDKVVAKTVELLDKRGFTADPVEYNCAGGRAGSFWLSPHNPHRKF